MKNLHILSLLTTCLLLTCTDLFSQFSTNSQTDTPQTKGDFWVVQLPHYGRVRYMLEVEDGYILYARSGLSPDSETWVFTFYKYSKTGELLWYREHPDAPRFPRDFIKTQDGGFMVTGEGELFKMYSDGNKHFHYVPDHSMWPTANFFSSYKAFSFGTPERYGYYFRVMYEDSTNYYSYPLIVDGGGELVKIDTLHRCCIGGGMDFSTENVNGNQLFISYPPQPQGNGKPRNFFSDYDFNPIQEKKHSSYSMIFPHKEFGYYRIPGNYWANINESPKYLIRYDDNMDSLWAHEYTDYLMTGVDAIVFKATTSSSDGGFILAGEISNLFFHTVWLVKADRDGNMVWRRGYAPHTISRELAYKSVAEADDGGVVFFTSGCLNCNDPENVRWYMFLVKTDPDGFVGLEPEIRETEKFVVYPNPATDKVTLSFVNGFTGTITVQTITGTLVHTANIQGGINYELDIKDLPTGIYAIVAIDTKTNKTYFQKIIKY
ncbi:MAG: T9SS type A sorting domain-containing protein [Salinivirgaceae bacterium]|jgi:hypothetical protein